MRRPAALALLALASCRGEGAIHDEYVAARTSYAGVVARTLDEACPEEPACTVVLAKLRGIPDDHPDHGEAAAIVAKIEAARASRTEIAAAAAEAEKTRAEADAKAAAAARAAAGARPASLRPGEGQAVAVGEGDWVEPSELLAVQDRCRALDTAVRRREQVVADPDEDDELDDLRYKLKSCRDELVALQKRPLRK